MGLWATEVCEQTSRDGLWSLMCGSRHHVMGSLTCGRRFHVMGLWVTDVRDREQTSRNGAVGHRFVGADIT